MGYLAKGRCGIQQDVQESAEMYGGHQKEGQRALSRGVFDANRLLFEQGGLGRRHQARSAQNPTQIRAEENAELPQQSVRLGHTRARPLLPRKGTRTRPPHKEDLQGVEALTLLVSCLWIDVVSTMCWRRMDLIHRNVHSFRVMNALL